MAVPDGASCWICLEEGNDEAGNPLVRNCSCRGDSAGFVHLSCLIKYAEQKCRHSTNSSTFTAPWEICPNCNQHYQNDLALDMSNAFVSFAAAAYGHPGNSRDDKIRVMDSLRSKIDRYIDNMKELPLKGEIEMAIKKMLSMVDQTKKDLRMNGWVHEPQDSDKYQYYKTLCGDYEGYAYHNLGMVTSLDLTETSYKMSMTYYQKSRAIHNLLGITEDSDQAENNLAVVKSAYALESAAGIDVKLTMTLLKAARGKYELCITSYGATSVTAIQSGVFYADKLKRAHRGIEAERLVMKITTDSRRVHGSAHNVTIRAHELLKACRERYVIVLADENRRFLALRCESDGDMCVVTGPIANLRQEDEEREYRVASHLILPVCGCLVICCGLVSAFHLNGKLGDVRSFHNTASGLRLAVHFENKSQKSALVRPENLRIAFELPNEE